MHCWTYEIKLKGNAFEKGSHKGLFQRLHDVKGTFPRGLLGVFISLTLNWWRQRSGLMTGAMLWQVRSSRLVADKNDCKQRPECVLLFCPFLGRSQSLWSFLCKKEKVFPSLSSAFLNIFFRRPERHHFAVSLDAYLAVCLTHRKRIWPLKAPVFVCITAWVNPCMQRPEIVCTEISVPFPVVLGAVSFTIQGLSCFLQPRGTKCVCVCVSDKRSSSAVL